MIRARAATIILGAPQVGQSDPACADHLHSVAARDAQATRNEMEWE